MKYSLRFRTLLAVVFIPLSLVLFDPLCAKASLAESLLERDLLPGIVELDRPIRIYHYYRLGYMYPQLATAVGRNSEARRYIDLVTERFWDIQYDARDYVNAGPGLYLATDPFISKSFGSQKTPEQISSLIEMVVPQGVRFLRVVNKTRSESKSGKVEPRLPLSPETLDALVSEGILSRSGIIRLFQDKRFRGNFFLRETLGQITRPEFLEFRRLVQRIFIRQNIQLIEYNWQSALAGFCRTHNYSSFNFIGQPLSFTDSFSGTTAAWPSISQTVELHLVTDPALPDLESQEALSIDRILKFRDVIETISSLVKQKKPTKDFIEQQYSSMDLRQLKNSLYRCEW